ncbi:MAG TPA: GNAT family protein, partial [Thermoplasmata archaeon]|nr:GNAT family protein [Thermoplasmata archaeon]
MDAVGGGVPSSFRPPVTLVGSIVRLVPLERVHATLLASSADDPDIWRYLPYGPRRTPSALTEHIDDLLARQATGTDLAFTVQLVETGAPVGMTRFLNVDRESGSVEIGGTWYSRECRRTSVNTESKRLLLGHAFEV